MKRGFLKTNSKAAPAARAEPKPSKPTLIPVSPQIPPEIPLSAFKFDVSLFDHFRVVNFPQFKIPTHFLLYPGTKEAMLEQFEPFNTFPPITTYPFIMNEVPGRGLGAFVKKAYNTGDLVWDEQPILVAPQMLPDTPAMHPEYYLKMMVDALSPPYAKSGFYKLHNCKSNKPQDVWGIWSTNALGVGTLPGPYKGAYGGIFLAMSRINHSCVPNVLHIWNPKTFSYYLAATRPISAGEEIFISYLNTIFDLRSQRQKTLSSKYAFTCTCAFCNLPKDLSARSDVKRKILSSAYDAVPKQQKEHEDELKKWIADPSLPDNHHVKPARFLIQLMEEEQAFDPILWLTQAEIICKALCALSDRAGVVEIAQKASVYAKTIFFGDDAGWNKVAAAPERTEWWGLRKKGVN